MKVFFRFKQEDGQSFDFKEANILTEMLYETPLLPRIGELVCFQSNENPKTYFMANVLHIYHIYQAGKLDHTAVLLDKSRVSAEVKE